MVRLLLSLVCNVMMCLKVCVMWVKKVFIDLLFGGVLVMVSGLKFSVL